jgi:hypothetical protein
MYAKIITDSSELMFFIQKEKLEIMQMCMNS